MSHAKVREDRYGHSKLRRRQLEKSSSPPNKMVGLGSDELFISNIADVNNMELEINSEDESDENERSDIRRLIPVNSESVIFSSGKRDIQRGETENADDESVWSISIQMFIPFLLAGFGMVAASLLLDVVQVSKQTLSQYHNFMHTFERFWIGNKSYTAATCFSLLRIFYHISISKINHESMKLMFFFEFKANKFYFMKEILNFSIGRCIKWCPRYTY